MGVKFNRPNMDRVNKRAETAREGGFLNSRPRYKGFDNGKVTFWLLPPGGEGGDPIVEMAQHWQIPGYKYPLVCPASFTHRRAECPICSAITELSTSYPELADSLKRSRAQNKGYANLLERNPAADAGKDVTKLIELIDIRELPFSVTNKIWMMLQEDWTIIDPNNAAVFQVEKSKGSNRVEYSVMLVPDPKKRGENAIFREPIHEDEAILEKIVRGARDLASAIYFPTEEEMEDIKKGAEALYKHFQGEAAKGAPGSRVGINEVGEGDDEEEEEPDDIPDFGGKGEDDEEETEDTEEEDEEEKPAAKKSKTKKVPKKQAAPKKPKGKGLTYPPGVDPVEFACYGGAVPHSGTKVRGYSEVIDKCLTCDHQEGCMAATGE